MTASIKNLLTSIIPKEQQWKITLFQNWDSIMGPLKDKVTIAQINNDTLLLKVIHPAWAQELHLLSSMLKQKINTCLGTTRIQNIRFVTSDIKTVKTNLRYRSLVEHRRKTYTENNATLNSKEAAITSNIQDAELKNALDLFFRRCKYLKGE